MKGGWLRCSGADLVCKSRLANGAKGAQHGEYIVHADRAVRVEIGAAGGGAPKFPEHHQHVAHTHGTIARQICGTVAA